MGVFTPVYPTAHVLSLCLDLLLVTWLVQFLYRVFFFSPDSIVALPVENGVTLFLRPKT